MFKHAGVIYLCLDLDRFFRECDGERERVLDLLERLDLLVERFLLSGRKKSKLSSIKNEKKALLCASVQVREGGPGSMAAAMVD